MENVKKIPILNFWTVPCNLQLIWFTPLTKGSSQLVTNRNNRNNFILKSADLKPSSWTALDGVVGLLFHAKLISSPVSPNHTVQGTTNSIFFSDVSWSLWTHGHNRLKHTHIIIIQSFQRWRRRLPTPPNVNHYYHLTDTAPLVKSLYN